MTNYLIRIRKYKDHGALVVLLLLSIALLPNRALQAEMPEHHEHHEHGQEAVEAAETMRQAIEVYKDMWVLGDRRVPVSVVQNARCIVVVPGLATGAILVGGSHGVGVASCRTDDTWGKPAFVRMNEVSLGAQLGARTTDLVLFIVDQDGANALRQGQVVMAGDLSVTAGSFDEGFDASNLGIVGYARSEGAYIGASIAGGNIAGDDEKNASFYTAPVSTVALLRGESPPQEVALANEFVEVLP